MSEILKIAAQLARREGLTDSADDQTFSWLGKLSIDLRKAHDESKAALAAKDAELSAAEDKRAEQWRLRRDAEASRDAAYAVVDSLKMEIARLREAMEGIVHFSDALNWRDDHLSKALAQWIEAGRAALAGGSDA